MAEEEAAAPNNKAALREGESARARFYRHKDKVLAGRTVKSLEEAGAFSGGPGSGIGVMFAQIRNVSDRLGQDPDDESALAEGVKVLDAMDAELKRLAG